MRDNQLIYTAYTATGDLYDKVTILNDFDLLGQKLILI